METTPAMRRIMRQHELTEPMVAAIYSGASGAIIDCPDRTYNALADRGILHRVYSTLTAKGEGILTALKAAQADAPSVVEGVIVTHAGTAHGSLPKHSDHADVRAALDALGDLRKAPMTDHTEVGDDLDPSVWGAFVEPRGNGRVALYWLEGGGYCEQHGEPFKVQLDILADKLREAGWTIEKRSVHCRFAHRPAPVAPVPEAEWTQFPVQVKAGDLIEAKTATRNMEPSTVRVRVDREPWLIGRDSAAISDGTGLNSVFTDTIRIVDETTPTPKEEPTMPTQAPSETIPTDEAGLIRLLAATPAQDRYPICERLAEQFGDQGRAHRLYERAEAEVLRDEVSDRLRRDLATALTAAQAELRKAEGLIAQLRGPEVYDVEYAESADAEDLLHMVAEAHRAARIAAALQAAFE
ncbi:hypothetical protein [Streptomyces sp. YIM S03343]